MAWVSPALLLAFSLAAAVSDLRWMTIPNRIVYPGILVGLIANTVIPGDPDGRDSLLGFGLCGLVMVVAFVLFGVGGGDVKLIAMMGAFLGLSRGVEAMLWTFVLGAVHGMAQLIWNVGAWELLKKSVHHLGLMLRYRQAVPLNPDERAELQAPLRLAAAAFLAELIVVFELLRFLP